MKPVTHVRCPVCGAPRKPGMSRCDYCGSWLLIFHDATLDDVDDEVVREHVDRLRSHLDCNPDDVLALHGLGVAYRNLGLFDDAIRVLARAANARPESLNIQRALAGTLYDAVREQPDALGMWRDVRRQADRMIALDPDSAEGWRLRAEVALRSGDDAGLIALAPELAAHDPDDDHSSIVERLQKIGEQGLRDWQWNGAVDAWEALAAVNPAAGRARLVEFLLQNSRLVTRSHGRVWRALRRTMALRGDFRQSMWASLALGIAVLIVMSVIGVWLAGPGFAGLIVIGGMVVWPVVMMIAVRTWLVGWPPLPTSKRPWKDITTEQLVKIARSIAPRIERVRPGG